MNTDTAREDLAFLRGLVRPDEGWQRAFGRIYAAGGACYGAQMIGHGLQQFGVIPGGGPTGLFVGAAPTVVFLALTIWFRSKGGPEAGGGVTSRAVGSMFGALGLANVFLIAIFATAAFREHNFKIWLLYPCVVLVMQGAAWLVAYALHRRAWFLLVAVGWLVIGLAMGLAIEDVGWYVLIGGIGFFAFMFAPGVAMIRQTQAAA